MAVSPSNGSTRQATQESKDLTAHAVAVAVVVTFYGQISLMKAQED